MKDPYKDLGVPKDATKDTIRKAYRKKAQKAHPDKGGTAEDFQALASAYALLSDDSARKRFDETGEVGAEPVDNLLVELSQLMLEVLQSVVDVGSLDLITVMKSRLADRAAGLKSQHKKVTREVEKLKVAQSRLSVKEGRENALASVLTSTIRSASQVLASLDAQVSRTEQLKERLLDYSYRFDPASTTWVTTSFGPTQFITRNA